MKKIILISIILLTTFISIQNLNAQNIFEAVKAGNLETIKALVDKNQNLLQTKDEVGNTPLHLAIENKKNDIAIFLINKGSDVNSISNTGETPLHIAAKWRANEIVTLLISKGSIVDVYDASNYTPLTNAIHHYQTTLQSTGKLETVKLLIDNGADINKTGMWGWLPIQVAAEFGSEEIVDYLIDKRANIPTEQGQASYQVLNAACSRGFARLFETLLDKGFDLQINRYTTNLIHLAASGGSEKIVEILLSKGFEVMTGDAYGWSPLHNAAEKGNLNVVKLFINKGADINDRTASGKSPYNLAVYFGQKEVCDFLISKGADTSEQQFPLLKGNYLGQKEPDNTPKVLAPDIVSTKYMLHGNIVFTPNGEEAYWSSWCPSENSTEEQAQILTTKLKDGIWTKPELATFSEIGFDDDCPFISPDGNKLFFVSRRPLMLGAEKSEKENIWYVTREGNTWGKPVSIEVVNSLKMHWQLSVDKKGDLYFGARDPEELHGGEIFCSKFENGKYTKPEKLSKNINSEHSEGSPYISPDGNYLLFDRSSQGMDMGLFISFRNNDGSWTEATAIAETAGINPQSRCAYVTPDGKFLFYINWYAGQSAAYWVNAGFIEQMKSNPPTPEKEILNAAKTGNLEQVKKLAEQNPELIKVKDQNGTTPLHLACSGRFLEIQKYLIEQGADMNAQEGDLSTPLHYAAVRNHIEGVAFLIEKGANINALDNENHTPLHLAAQYGLRNAVNVLVKNGANLELRDDYGRTPLVLGSRERGGPLVIKTLLEGGADVNSIDNSGWSSLRLASWRGYKEVVDILLDHEAQLPTQNEELIELLSTSAQKGLVRIFRSVVESGFDISNVDNLLNDAASGGSEEIVSDLIDLGFNLNQLDVNGWTPMHYATFNGRTDAVKMLIQKGADLNHRNLMGQTPFNIADEKGYTALKQIFVDHQADQSPIKFPELRGDYLGQTPPGKTPQIFAQGIISSIWGLHSTAVFSPDGNEVYWCPMITKPDAAYSTGGPFMMKRINGIWTPPQQPAPFNDEIEDDVPFFSIDGQHLYMISRRLMPGERYAGEENIWVMDKIASGWSEMYPFNETINAQEMHWQFSMDKLGNVYFGSSAAGGKGMMDIYCAQFVDGKYNTPINLGEMINTEKNEMAPFISPDGSYLIYHCDEDLYVNFRKKDGSWSEAINMESSINSESFESSPMVTADGKYLFFNSARAGDISAYWVDAAIIEKLRPKDMK